MLDLSVIILSYNTKRLTINCLESIIKNTQKINYELIVIDNASTDGSIKYLTNHRSRITAHFRLIKNQSNLGFAKANNQGIRIAKGKYILLLNSDTKLREDSLTKMVRWMDQNPRVGVIGPTLVDTDGSIQLNGGFFPNLMRLFLWATFLDDIPGVALLFGSYHLSSNIPITKGIYGKSHQQDWVSGAVFLLRKGVIDNVGGFDEDIFMYGEEVEYCFRIKKAGWRIWYLPITKVLHIGMASSKGELVRFAGVSVGKESSILGEFRALKYFYQKHYPKWQYPILLLLIKLAALLRILVFGFLGGQKEASKTYAKAFELA